MDRRQSRSVKARRTKRRPNITLICALAAAVVFACAFSVVLVLFVRERNSSSDISDEYGTSLSDDGNELASMREAAQKSENEINILKERIAELESSLSESGEVVSGYESELQMLKDRLAGKENEIAELNANISKLESVYLVDINAQFEILSSLSELLSNPPIRHIITETENPDGSVTVEESEGEPLISLCYFDFTNGYTYSFNADVPMNPASMIKLPYVLSLLIKASEEEEDIQGQIEAYKKAHPDEEVNFISEGRKYDMSRKITYTRDEYYQEGSGEIAESDDGTEYTYLELFYHILECSDNVAYNIIHNEYGKTVYSDFLRRLGTKSLLQGKMEMTASDAVKVLGAVYEFTESDAYYAAFMKDAMINSRHLVMIPFAVRPLKCAHKYGWDIDSYCDMAIVYDEHPYAVVIMTNYDTGGDEVNEYIRSILTLINDMHTNYYKAR